MKKSVIVSSIISLFDISIEYQIKTCQKYCDDINAVVIEYIKDIGFIDDNKIFSDKWQKIIKSDVTFLVFYQVKQLSISVGYFYELFNSSRKCSLGIYFVKDNLLFDGFPPSLSLVTNNEKKLNRKKILDFITLYNIKSSTDKVLFEFINSNFNDVSSLIYIINNDIIWFKRILRLYRLKSKKNKNLTYKKITNRINKIDSTQKNNNIDNICVELQSIKI
ncbi:hypothetical protein [Brazilian porcupinepox virus 1]|nr:hypothetical protein [Brazilian porcupinepox virus 1]